jgi:hypothetical protein
VLENIDYWQILHDEPSAMEQLYAIFANVIEMNDEGEVTNAKYERRYRLENGGTLEKARQMAAHASPNPALRPARGPRHTR